MDKITIQTVISIIAAFISLSLLLYQYIIIKKIVNNI